MLNTLTFPLVRDFALALDDSGNLLYKATSVLVVLDINDLYKELNRWSNRDKLSNPAAVLYTSFTDRFGTKIFVSITKEAVDINSSMSNEMFIALLSN